MLNRTDAGLQIWQNGDHWWPRQKNAQYSGESETLLWVDLKEKGRNHWEHFTGRKCLVARRQKKEICIAIYIQDGGWIVRKCPAMWI